MISILLLAAAVVGLNIHYRDSRKGLSAAERAQRDQEIREELSIW